MWWPVFSTHTHHLLYLHISKAVSFRGVQMLNNATICTQKCVLRFSHSSPEEGRFYHKYQFKTCHLCPSMQLTQVYCDDRYLKYAIFIPFDTWDTLNRARRSRLTVVWRLQLGLSAASLLHPPPWCSKRSGLEPQTLDLGPPRSQSSNTRRALKLQITSQTFSVLW